MGCPTSALGLQRKKPSGLGLPDEHTRGWFRAARKRMDGLRCRRCGRRCDAGDRFCRHCGTSRAPSARWRLTRTITAITVAALLTLAAADEDIIEGVATHIEVEATRQAAMGLEDAHAVEAQPKLIRVTGTDMRGNQPVCRVHR